MVKISMCMTGISNSRVYVRRGGKVGYLRAAMIEQIVHKGSENFGDFSIAAISSWCHSLMASARYNHSSDDGNFFKNFDYFLLRSCIYALQLCGTSYIYRKLSM